MGYTPNPLRCHPFPFPTKNTIDTSVNVSLPPAPNTHPLGNSRVVVGRSRGKGTKESNEDFAEAPLTWEVLNTWGGPGTTT